MKERGKEVVLVARVNTGVFLRGDPLLEESPFLVVLSGELIRMDRCVCCAVVEDLGREIPSLFILRRAPLLELARYVA